MDAAIYLRQAKTAFIFYPRHSWLCLRRSHLHPIIKRTNRSGTGALAALAAGSSWYAKPRIVEEQLPKQQLQLIPQTNPHKKLGTPAIF